MDSKLSVYRLKLNLENFTGEAPGNLPPVRCELCGQRGYHDTAFPLIKASDFPNFTAKFNPNKLAPSISWSKFRKEVVEHVRALYGDAHLELLPGSSLGPIEIEPIGMWPKELKDIDLASPGGLLFSGALINKLRERNIFLPFQPVNLKNRKGFVLIWNNATSGLPKVSASGNLRSQSSLSVLQPM